MNIYAASRIASEQPPLVATLLFLLLLLLLLSRCELFLFGLVRAAVDLPRKNFARSSMLRLNLALIVLAQPADAGFSISVDDVSLFTNSMSLLLGFRLRDALQAFAFKDTGAAT